MKPLYPRLTTLIESLDQIPGARRDEPYPEGDGPGDHLAEEIRRDQSRSSLFGNEPGIVADTDDELEEGLAESGEPPAPMFWFPDGVDVEQVVRRLAGANGDEYRRLSLVKGIDAFAWYVGFHQRAYQWGVYIPVTGLASYAVQALGKTDIAWEDKLNVALRTILAHERFHFSAEVGVAQVELALQRAVYFPAVGNKDVFSEARLLEEKLATAAQLRATRFARDAAARRSFRDLRDHSKRLPPGYREGHQLVARRHDFENRMLDHAQKIWEAAFGALPASGLELHHLYPTFRPYELGRCPVHVLCDQARFGLTDLPFFLIDRVEIHVETEGFSKRLARLPEHVRRKWEKTRRLLAQSTMIPGLDFKPWAPGGKDCFSVRVDRSLRAHLRFDASASSWRADSIGSHAEMGHG